MPTIFLVPPVDRHDRKELRDWVELMKRLFGEENLRETDIKDLTISEGHIMHGLYLRDRAFVYDDKLVTCLALGSVSTHMQDLELLKASLELNEIVILKDPGAYFEGGNIFVAKNAAGDQVILHGTTPGGNYHYGFAGRELGGMKGFTEIAPSRAEAASIAFKEELGANVINIKLNMSLLSSKFVQVLKDMWAPHGGIPKDNPEILSEGPAAMAGHFVQSAYYHLDMFMHVTADNKIIILNKELISTDSLMALEKYIGKENIIHLEYSIDKILKDKPVLNCISSTVNGRNVILFPNLPSDLKAKIQSMLPNYDINFADTTLISTASGLGGGLHCVTQQRRRPSIS